MKQAHAVAKQQASLPIHLLTTRSSDYEECYFLLRTSRARFMQLLAKRQRERVNIADYGEILASGYGSQPSEQDIARLQQQGIELPKKF